MKLRCKHLPGLAAAGLCFGMLLAVLIGSVQPAAAQERDNEVSTTLNKSLVLTAGDEVNISNRYGPVEITASSGSELKVVMTATAWAGSKSRAEALLERIGLIYEREGKSIQFKTEIESRSGITWNTDASGFRISVKVTMPESNDLKVSNRYGNTYFMDEVYKGRVTIEQSYGNLKGNRLEAPRCSVTVRYGKIDLDTQLDGFLKVAYGEGRVRRLGRVNLDTGYSRLDIDEADDLVIDSDYDNLSLGNIGQLRGSGSYSGLHIDRLDRSIELTTSYVTGFRIDKVSEGFSLIDLRGNYSSFTLDFENQAAFAFDIRLKRGNLRYPNEGLEVSRLERENDNNVIYAGRRGAPNKGRVFIEGSYTNVRFGIIGLTAAPRSSNR